MLSTCRLCRRGFASRDFHMGAEGKLYAATCYRLFASNARSMGVGLVHVNARRCPAHWGPRVLGVTWA